MNKLEIMPPLRPVTAMRAAMPNGMEIVVLRDSSGIGHQEVIVSPDVLELLRFFDGKTPIAAVKARFLQTGVKPENPHVIDELIDALDKGLIVEGTAFQIVTRNFRRQSFRAAVHAGVAYPDNTAMCHRMIEDWLKESTMEVGEPFIEPPAGGRLSGIIAPHYDLRGSGPTMLTAHRAMWRDFETHGEPDIVIILGTAHHTLSTPIAMTRKSYIVPIGEIPADNELIDALAGELPFDPFEDELFFRSEFVCEFQALILAYYKQRHPQSRFTILPVLVAPSLSCDKNAGATDADSDENGEHAKDIQSVQDEEIARLVKIVEAFRRALEATGKRAVFIASADMAHVGDRFDDSHPLTNELILAVEHNDLQTLDILKDNDPVGFVSHIAEQGNPYAICSIPVMFMVAEQARSNFIKSDLLQYTQFEEEDTQSLVSFAAMSFYDKI